MGIEKTMKSKMEEMEMNITIMWPDVFTAPSFEYPEGHDSKGAAIADGLVGWANCIISKDKIPDQFGKGMIKVGARVGISPTAENLSSAADKWIKERDEMKTLPE